MKKQSNIGSVERIIKIEPLSLMLTNNIHLQKSSPGCM